MARTAEAILVLARKAAYGSGSHPLWSHEDWEDAIQEAATAIVRLAPDAYEGVCVLAGKHAIYDWMRRWYNEPLRCPFDEAHDYAHPDRDPPWPLDYLDALAPLLSAQHAQKVDEDMAYLRLLLRGYSMVGIAQELGISIRNTFAIRERTIPRLERIARGEWPARYTANVQPSSRAALARINSDPAMLARRGEAIRAGWARRKQEQQR